jgi:hypothetical protein
MFDVQFHSSLQTRLSDTHGSNPPSSILDTMVSKGPETNFFMNSSYSSRSPNLFKTVLNSRHHPDMPSRAFLFLFSSTHEKIIKRTDDFCCPPCSFEDTGRDVA